MGDHQENSVQARATSADSFMLSNEHKIKSPIKNNILPTLKAIQTLRQKKELSLAAQKAKDYLRKNDFSVEILSLLVDLLIDQRSAQKALDTIQHYQSEINKLPKCKELITAQAKALLATDQKIESLALIQTTTAAFPTWADGWNNHGCTLLNMGLESAAIEKFEQALKLEPDHFKAALALATILKKHGYIPKAIETLQNCFNQSNNPLLLEGLINLLNQTNQHILALDYAKKLTESNQTPSIDQQMLLARCHFLNGDLHEYIQTLRNCPDQQLWKGVSVRSIVEGVIAESGLQNQVGSKLEELLQEAPSDPNANLIVARERLRQFDFTNGWRHYAHRLKLPSPQLHFNELPNWDGSKLRGENILVIGEQGIGDVGYFARFLYPLMNQNNVVCMLCEPRMKGFLQHSFPNIFFFSDPNQIKNLPKSITRIALGSLPLLYGGDVDSIQKLGHQAPLLSLPADQNIWKERLLVDSGGLPVIGISLLGGRNGDEYQQRKRSLPIQETLQLFSGRELAFLDLQHPSHGEEFSAIAKELNLKILNYPHLTDDISQLLAAMSCLDGLITAQQTNAHLAGSIGLRGVVALPVVSHFVYGLESTTPWYPSLKLIRANKFGEWDACIDALEIELDQWQAL